MSPAYGADGRRLGAFRREMLLRSIQNDIETQIHIEYDRYGYVVSYNKGASTAADVKLTFVIGYKL